LDRGFSITLHEGKRLRRVSDVCHGNELQTILSDGSIDSHVDRVQQKK